MEPFDRYAIVGVSPLSIYYDYDFVVIMVGILFLWRVVDAAMGAENIYILGRSARSDLKDDGGGAGAYHFPDGEVFEGNEPLGDVTVPVVVAREDTLQPSQVREACQEPSLHALSVLPPLPPLLPPPASPEEEPQQELRTTQKIKKKRRKRT